MSLKNTNTTTKLKEKGYREDFFLFYEKVSVYLFSFIIILSHNYKCLITEKIIFMHVNEPRTVSRMDKEK